MRERWTEDIRERARAYWTPDRLHGVLGDKNLLLPPTEAPELLRALGLMELDGAIPPDRMRKYRQVNHLLALVRPALVQLADRHDRVTLIDAGCGRSYLTLLVAWWFERIARHPLDLVGVDRSEALVATSRERAEAAGLRSVRFVAADLAELEPATLGLPALHGLLALHACDTATDDALAYAIQHRAEFLAVAPCCQRELSAAWADRLAAEPDHPLAPLWSSPHLRRTTAATATDAMRTELLRAAGYRVSAVEFVEAFHTPKNTLIRANRVSEGDPAAAERYRAMAERLGGDGIGLGATVLGVSDGA